MAASLVLDDRTGHHPQSRGGRDGMSDDAFMWGMWLGRGTAVSNRDNSREQPRQQQGATDTTTDSNREDSREQPRGKQEADCPFLKNHNNSLYNKVERKLFSTFAPRNVQST